MLTLALRRLALCGLLGCLIGTANAETVSRIRLFLHSTVAEPGAMPAATLAHLQAIAGASLTVAGATRTGAVEISFAQPLDAEVALALVKRLRDDRSVVWAEALFPARALQSKSVNAKANEQIAGDKLMVRLASGVTPDWSSLLPQWASVIGASVAVDHQIGDIWVLKLPSAVPDSQLANMASQLETHPAVQYADPVRRATIKSAPDDPDYPQQWALSDPVGGINAENAWDLTHGSAAVTVAVVDTGLTAHPELAGRVLPGYDFVTNPASANDGNGRDNDATDPGDAISDGDCGGARGRPSSWHGTFVSGLIAANTNNGAGIAGVDWNARILPVRVLGKCGGTFDDIAAGVLWAAGLPVTGAPPNPNPARVINMSIGGGTPCPQALQDAINQAAGQGTVIVVAAGNETDDATTSSPANCSGVITVAGSTRQGDRTSYSNYGRRVDIAAPGGDGSIADSILSISNDGQSSLGNPTYKSEVGTSFAAPHVAGAASLMFARNANLTPGRMLNIMVATARAFPSGSGCAIGNACGAGLLDAGFALHSIAAGDAAAPAGTVPVVEYYRADKDHYFMSASPQEIGVLDNASIHTFQRTNEVFYAWPTAAVAPIAAVPVCRFYSSLPLIDSHFYTASASECQYVRTHWAGTWTLENPAAFYVMLPDATGACPAATVPVYRFFDNRNDANHRHTIDLSVRRAMLNRQWAPEGTGVNGVAFCAPM